MDYRQHITRTQLKGYGISYYQAQVITKKLTSIGKENNTNIYLLSQVIVSTKEYLIKPKIAKKTRESLSYLLPRMIQQLDNVTPVIFGKSTDPELNQLSKKLFMQVTKTEQNLTKAKARIATIKGKYQK